MAGKQKLKPDIVLKNYWNGNEEFADFFNAVLFRGKQIIQPDELEEVDTEGSTVLEHREYAESVQASRDNIKIQKKSTGLGVRLVMLGLDHQEHIHYAMPLRVMGYDYATYKKQYDSNVRKYADAKGLTEDEYLSKMRQSDKFVPVITVIVYYGEKPWDGAKSLHEMLNLPEDVAEFINDYPMHLVEARNTELIFHNKNNRDLFELLQIFLNRSASGNSIANAAVKYNDDHMPDKIVFMAVAGAINRKIDYHVFEKEGNRMCTFFDELEKRGEVRGEARGEARGETKGEARGIVETGLLFGASVNDILSRLQEKLNVSSGEAQKYFNMYSI